MSPELNLNERWQALLQTDEIFENKLTERFLAATDVLASEIEQLSLRSIYRNKSILRLIHQPELRDFFQKSAQEGKAIRITSDHSIDLQLTKKEHFYFGLDWDGYLKAVLQAVALQFKRETLLQRADAGDKHLFDLPNCAILIQQTLGKDSSRSFHQTCDATSQDIPALTPGLSVARCFTNTFEYVIWPPVPSGVISWNDRQSANMYYRFNFGPSYQQVKNDPVLSFQAQEDIHELLRTLELVYGQPVFVSFVVDTQNKKFNIFEVKKITLPKNEHPEYIDRHSSCPSHDCALEGISGAFFHTSKQSIIKVTSCYHQADSSVRLITSQYQVLFAPKIEEALAIYKHSSAVEIIIVDAHENNDLIVSPALIRFAELGKVVIALSPDNREKLQEWLRSDLAVLLDIQNRIIIQAPHHTQNKLYSLPQLHENGIVKRGRQSHPLFSMFTEPLKPETLKEHAQQSEAARILQSYAHKSEEDTSVSHDYVYKYAMQSCIKPLLIQCAKKIQDIKQQMQEVEEGIIIPKTFSEKCVRYLKSFIVPEPSAVSLFEREYMYAHALFYNMYQAMTSYALLNLKNELQKLESPLIKHILSEPVSEDDFTKQKLALMSFFAAYEQNIETSLWSRFQTKKQFIEHIQITARRGFISYALLEPEHRKQLNAAFTEYKEAALVSAQEKSIIKPSISPEEAVLVKYDAYCMRPLQR